MVNQALIQAYKYHCGNFKHPRHPAWDSIALARQDVALGVARYPTSRHISYARASDDGLRWIENATNGLRFVDTCDAIAHAQGMARSIDHEGWYTDREFPEDTLRGVVFQLPGRKGKPLYVAGYAASHDCEVSKVQRRSSWKVTNARLDLTQTFNELIDAARMSDEHARIAADNECDYQETWRAGQRYFELGETIQENRKTVSEICRELRAYRRQFKASEFPKIRSLMRDTLRKFADEIAKAKRERGKLLAAAPSRGNLADAWREGACMSSPATAEVCK